MGVAVVWIDRRAEMRIETQPGIGKFRQVQLAHAHHARGSRVGDADKIAFLRRLCVEQERAAGSRRVGDVEKILPCNRNPVEDRQRPPAAYRASAASASFRARAGVMVINILSRSAFSIRSSRYSVRAIGLVSPLR